MSLYPIFLGCDRPSHRYLNEWNFNRRPENYLTIVTLPHIQGYENPQTHSSEIDSTIKKDKDTFQVNLDVHHFAPEEISVQTVDGFLVVEATHEEKQDEHGFISRSFKRKYSLPENVDPNSLTSKLSSDGVLTISAPLKISTVANERTVPIIRTGPVRKQVEDSSQ